MTAEKDHIPALDGLRALAACAVVVKHLGARWGGDTASYTFFLGPFGVLLFFTLSGFLISYLYASQKFTLASVYGYAVSRFSRIVPVLLFLLLLFLLFTVISLAQKYGSEQLYLDNEIYLSPYCSILCAATVLSFSYSNKFSDTVFGCRLMRLLGAWSLAIYLIHEPFLQISEPLYKTEFVNKEVAAALAVVAAIGIAAILHIYFEKPMQAVMKKKARSLFDMIVRHLPKSDGISI